MGLAQIPLPPPPPPPPSVSLATTSGGNVANELIITRRKFSLQEPSYIFIPLTIDTAGVLGSEAKVFIQDLGRKIGEQLVVPDPTLSRNREKQWRCKVETLPPFWAHVPSLLLVLLIQ